MNKKPKTSTIVNTPIKVAMITYNGHKHFEEQLKSILSQSTTCNIDIYDDYSDNEFVKHLKSISSKHNNIKIHLAYQNHGVIRNVKKALEKTEEGYVALADQDDFWLPNKLKLTLEKIKEIEDPSLPALVHHDMGIINEEGDLKPNSFWEVMRQKSFTHTFEANVIMNLVTGCASLMNKELTNFAKDIPEDLKTYHDAWLGMVAYTMGKTASINTVLSNHRQHSSSLTFSQKTKPSISNRVKLNALQMLGFKNTFDAQFDFIERFLDSYYSQLDQYHKAYMKSFLLLRKKNYWAQKKFIWKAINQNK